MVHEGAKMTIYMASMITIVLVALMTYDKAIIRAVATTSIGGELCNYNIGGESMDQKTYVAKKWTTFEPIFDLGWVTFIWGETSLNSSVHYAKALGVRYNGGPGGKGQYPKNDYWFVIPDISVVAELENLLKRVQADPETGNEEAIRKALDYCKSIQCSV